MVICVTENWLFCDILRNELTMAKPTQRDFISRLGMRMKLMNRWSWGYLSPFYVIGVWISFFDSFLRYL